MSVIHPFCDAVSFFKAGLPSIRKIQLFTPILALFRTLHTVEAIKRFFKVLNKHSHRQVGNKGGEDRGIECEAESKPYGTANLFRHIPSGVMKSVS
jgi:hypothetical protein